MKPVWIFDLDDTLHDSSAGVFPLIHRKMTDYIVTELGMTVAEAEQLRRLYWGRYGATMEGLVRHHGVTPDHFLQQTHPLDEINEVLCREAQLSNWLRRLPGRKLVLSNGPIHYVEHVLENMRIHRHFERCYGVDRIGLIPKPDPRAYQYLLARERLDPRQCIMVEDSLANLKTAKKLGMRTVWVSRSPRKPAFVDARITRLNQLERCFS